jgi:hypothetical protein
MFCQNQKTNRFCIFTKAFAVRSKPTNYRAVGIASLVNQANNMPTDFTKKWTGDDCRFHQLIGLANHRATPKVVFYEKT